MEMATLLVTDSQGRGMEELQPGLTVAFYGGARARNLPHLVANKGLTPYQTIAVWIRGNDAHPRMGLLNKALFSGEVSDFLTLLESTNPDSRLVITSASHRASPAPFGNISKLTPSSRELPPEKRWNFAILSELGYRSKELLSPYLEKRVMHLRKSTKTVVARALFTHLRYHNRNHKNISKTRLQ